MSTMETLTTFFGWCAVINVALLLLATVTLAFMRGIALDLHASMFELSKEDLLRAYFQYLAQFKIAALVLSVAPYFALKIMA